jgi:hypothetical protein
MAESDIEVSTRAQNKTGALKEKRIILDEILGDAASMLPCRYASHLTALVSLVLRKKNV